VLLALYWWTLAPSIAELHDNVDSGELVAVASVSGIAHPPGSAIWLPVARLALEAFVFLEEPAARTNLLSAICMAAAAGLLGLAVLRWRPATPVWAAALATIIAGTAPLTWSQGIVTEVLALQALLTSAALVLAPDAARGKRWPAFALVLGLLAWNHPTGLALVVPLAAACLWRGRPGRAEATRAMVMFALPGVFSIAYLWLRADASIAWGDTSSVRGIWEHLSGQIYQGAIERSPTVIVQGIPETLRRTLGELPPPAWLLVIPGTLVIAQSRPAFGVAMTVMCVLVIVFVSAYRATGRQDYLAPVLFVAAMAAAYGADEAWTWARRRLPTRRSAHAAALCAWGLVAVWMVNVGNDVSLRGDTTLRDNAVAWLEVQEPGAVLLTSSDAETFSLWYAVVVLGVRPDVTVIDVRGLAPVVGGHVPPAPD
jgi:hypothetical protein